LDEEIIDHVVWKDENLGNYEISIVARLKGPGLYSVQFILRLRNPDDEVIDYMLSLNGFKKLGKLCVALSKFCEDPIFVNEKKVEALKKLLTVENIMNYVKMSAMKRRKA
jgi:hypothetical protein